MIPQEAEEGLTSEVEPMVNEEEVSLEQALAEEKERAQSYLANWQRAQADFVNYKRRSEQEKEELSQFAKSVLILNLLPVLDDMERALASIPSDIAELSWVEGIKLIERKLRGILETEGLSPIKAIGKSFDPYLHEAIRQEKGEEGIVIEEVQKGYEFRNRVIRPSKVVVGNGEDGASG
jgi:molecular chaperone GrpE